MPQIRIFFCCKVAKVLSFMAVQCAIPIPWSCFSDSLRKFESKVQSGEKKNRRVEIGITINILSVSRKIKIKPRIP